MQILVVEDEPKVASFVRQALTEAGYAVTVAHDGLTGLRLAQAAEYDAVIVDCLLPRIDGLSFCRELRGPGRETPVLMVTARDGLDDKITGLDAGADDYLTKPFSIDEMLARLRALLRRQSGRGQSATLTVDDLTMDAPAEVTLWGDSDALTRLIRNLLENAVLKVRLVSELGK